MSFDIGKTRADTPGCKNRIHFNNAGASLPPRQVTDAMIEYLRLEAQIGGYEAAEQEHAKLERAYLAVAELIGARRNEIALMENATRAWEMALYSIPLKPGDRILTACAEYPGNYVSLLHYARRTDATVKVIPDDESGRVSLDALRNSIDDRVKMIALTHISTNNGLVNPAEEVGRIAKDAGVHYLLDAAQSAGQMPLDVNRIECDMLTATCRKYLRGPRGAAFLYVRQGLIPRLDPPLLDHSAADLLSLTDYSVHEDARRFETWETSHAARIGLGVAIDYALSLGLESIRTRVTGLADRLRARLREMPYLTVEDVGREQCGIVTFTHARLSPEDIRRELAALGINTIPRPVTPLDVLAGRAKPVLRASVHYYNTEEEMDRMCTALEEMSA